MHELSFEKELKYLRDNWSEILKKYIKAHLSWRSRYLATSMSIFNEAIELTSNLMTAKSKIRENESEDNMIHTDTDARIILDD